MGGEILGKYTYGIGNIQLAYHHNSPPLNIDRFCVIAGNVKIFTGAYHRSDWITTYLFGILHQNVFFWCTIPFGFPYSNGAGYIIGDSAIIAVNAHVIKSVAPYEIVGGNPAKHIKFRSLTTIYR